MSIIFDLFLTITGDCGWGNQGACGQCYLAPSHSTPRISLFVAFISGPEILRVFWRAISCDMLLAPIHPLNPKPGL